MNEVATQEDTAITTTSNPLMDMLGKALENPKTGADTIHKLLDANERILETQKVIDFNEAMARLQPKLPIIEKTTAGHNCKYAKYEHIQFLVRPLYTAEGFSTSYTSKKVGEQTTYYGTLRHKGGHSITAEITLPDDDSGKKNGVHAVGSTFSYAKRYLLSALLDLIIKDEDDNADSFNIQPIDTVQFDEITRLITESNTSIESFCKFMGVACVKDIQSKYYPKAVNQLKAKIGKNNA